MQGVTIRVNVGIDATNPARRIDKMTHFAMALQNFGMTPNGEEFSREIAGALGFDDGERFIGEPPEPAPDPMAEIKAQEMELRMQEMQMNFETAQIKNQIAQEQLKFQQAKAGEDLHVNQIKIQGDLDDRDKDRESREQIALLNDSTKLKIAGLQADIQEMQALLADDQARVQAMMADNQNREKARAENS